MSTEPKPMSDERLDEIEGVCLLYEPYNDRLPKHIESQINFIAKSMKIDAEREG